jgi:hypothetical protein
VATKTDIQNLQDQIDILLKERDERRDQSNPVANTVAALQDHLAVRVGSLPNQDLTDLVERAGQFDAKTLNRDDTEAFNYALSRFVAKNGPVAHEFAYIQDLGTELHQHALDSASSRETLANNSTVEDDDAVVVDDEDEGKGEN